MASPIVTDVDLDVEFVKRNGFAEFVQLAWEQIEGTPLIWGKHMKLICDHYEAVFRGEIKDMCVNVPPGTSKSTISSVLFPVWCWIKAPWKKFICVTYDEKLALRFAERSLDLILGDWFQARWPHVQIEKGSKAAIGFYETTEGGERFTTMMGGAAVGRHCHILMIDDPIKPDDLRAGGDSAKLALDLAWTRFIETFSTRKADANTFARIIIMQRLHMEDVAGKFTRNNRNCVHLRLPMEFESAHGYKSQWGDDWRTEEGELLAPQRFPASVIEDLKRDMTARSYASQYQQRPTPESGALFQRGYFLNRWQVVPNGLKWLISVDANLKEANDADFFVAQVWAWRGAEYYLMDQIRGQFSLSDGIESIKKLKGKWPQVGNILIEDKANGPAIISTLKSKVPGILAVNPEGGKESRANSIEPILRAMNCSFPYDAWWLENMIEEFISFPVASHDDCVDCASQAIMFMSGKSRPAKFRKAMEQVRTGKSRLAARLRG